MKKVGVLTLPLTNNNYGGILQAYALQTYLSVNLGCDVETIDRRHGVKGTLSYRLRHSLSRILQKDLHVVYNSLNHPFEKFINQFIKTSKPLFTFQQATHYIEGRFDILITGSDQVWRPEYAKDLYKDLFLAYPIDQVKKVSYAASFGIDQWTDTEIREEVQGYLNRLYFVSVREDSGVELCKATFDVDASHHIDPTLLLTPSDYKMLYGEEKETGLLAYILDPSDKKEEFMKSIATIMGLPVQRIGRKIRINRHNYKLYRGTQHDSIESWLKAFASAEFIVTDSFHGVAFSILFNKPFIALGNANRGLTRFNSLLKLFSLEDRLVTEINGDSFNLVNSIITYDNVNLKLEAERLKAKEYFDKILR